VLDVRERRDGDGDGGSRDHEWPSVLLEVVLAVREAARREGDVERSV